MSGPDVFEGFNYQVRLEGRIQLRQKFLRAEILKGRIVKTVESDFVFWSFVFFCDEFCGRSVRSESVCRCVRKEKGESTAANQSRMHPLY